MTIPAPLSHDQFGGNTSSGIKLYTNQPFIPAFGPRTDDQITIRTNHYCLGVTTLSHTVPSAAAMHRMQRGTVEETENIPDESGVT